MNIERGALFIYQDVLGLTLGDGLNRGDSPWDVAKITFAHVSTYNFARTSFVSFIDGNPKTALGIACLGLGFEAFRFLRRVRNYRLWEEGMQNPIIISRDVQVDGVKMQVLSIGPGKKEKNGN